MWHRLQLQVCIYKYKGASEVMSLTNARGAESTLTAVALCKPLLDCMQASTCSSYTLAMYWMMVLHDNNGRRDTTSIRKSRHGTLKEKRIHIHSYTLHRELAKMRIWIVCVDTSTVVTARPCMATTGARQALTLKKEENFKFNQQQIGSGFR